MAILLIYAKDMSHWYLTYKFLKALFQLIVCSKTSLCLSWSICVIDLLLWCLSFNFCISSRSSYFKDMNDELTLSISVLTSKSNCYISDLNNGDPSSIEWNSLSIHLKLSVSYSYTSVIFLIFLFCTLLTLLRRLLKSK